MEDELDWYCLMTGPKQEGLAVRMLRTDVGIEVFCPFLRFERPRGGRRMWVTEAMFPGYIFAKFRYISQRRHIISIGGVSKIVGFGGMPVLVAPQIISELRALLKDDETVTIQTGIEPGDEVNMISGPFSGLRAVVTRVMPGRERVSVLLELLGMEREVEVPAKAVIPDVEHPMTHRKA